MTEKRFVCYFDNIVKKWCVHNTDSLDMHYVADEPMGEEFAHLLNLYHQTLDNVEKENEQLKKELEEYTNPDKYILIKKADDSQMEYNSCQDCIHYDREYEEIIAFGDYETLTRETCACGHDIDDVDANKCPDYF